VKLRRARMPNPAWMLVVPAIQLPLLLVFFMFLGGSYLLQPGVSVEVPSSPFLLSPQRDSLVVAVPPPPATTYYLQEEVTDLTGLREFLESRPTRSATIVVRADRRAPVERVSAVMSVALSLGYQVVMATAEELQ